MITSKLQQLEWITLNVASIGWVVIDVLEALPTAVTVLVGLSIVFLNISRGIKALREGKKANDNDRK